MRIRKSEFSCEWRNLLFYQPLDPFLFWETVHKFLALTHRLHADKLTIFL